MRHVVLQPRVLFFDRLRRPHQQLLLHLLTIVRTAAQASIHRSKSGALAWAGTRRLPTPARRVERLNPAGTVLKRWKCARGGRARATRS